MSHDREMNVDEELDSLTTEELGNAMRGLGMMLIAMLLLVIAVVRN